MYHNKGLNFLLGLLSCESWHSPAHVGRFNQCIFTPCHGSLGVRSPPGATFRDDTPLSPRVYSTLYTTFSGRQGIPILLKGSPPLHRPLSWLSAWPSGSRFQQIPRCSCLTRICSTQDRWKSVGLELGWRAAGTRSCYMPPFSPGKFQGRAYQVLIRL